jgi:hypothetical protein
VTGRLYTTEEAASRLRRSPETLKYWRKNGAGPRAFRLGRLVMYAEEDLNAYIDNARANHPVGAA